jgi:endonuclease-8
MRRLHYTMPEGDTIYRTAATLHRALAGRIVTAFETAYAQLARVDDDAPIAGRRVESVRSAGKHVLMAFSPVPPSHEASTDHRREDAKAGQDGPLVLRTHMRMNGSWHIYRHGERWQLSRSAMRVMVATGEWVAVAFNVPVAEFLQAGSISRRSAVAELGPDLLSPTFDEAEAVRRIQLHPREPIADVLLNQRAVAGIGNVYKSETLFVAGVHPFTPVDALDRDTIVALLTHARRLLLANIQPTSPAQIVTYGGLKRETGRAQFGNGLWVYARRGLPCRKCGAPIEAKKTGPHARGTFWCPNCQK